MVEHGDPNKATCEASESFGSDIKFSMHILCVRRRRSKGKTQHSRHNGSDDDDVKEWLQTFTVSRLIQTFRRACFRRKVLSDPTYTHLQQRSHAKLAVAGFASKRRKGGITEMGKVTSFETRVEKAMECYDCEKYDPEA
jgi:hypothetical protein